MNRNAVSEMHERATQQMLNGMASQAVGLDRGRYAYGLPCGGGKTQGVIALISASYELGLELSFAVATSQIEALCGIKRDCVFHAKPNADSTASRARIPQQSERRFHGKPSRDSTTARARI
ncbi:hypothetical protein LJ655_17570, partial [Paraburkholderia sp. MMS20-SJTN17]